MNRIAAKRVITLVPPGRGASASDLGVEHLVEQLFVCIGRAPDVQQIGHEVE